MYIRPRLRHATLVRAGVNPANFIPRLSHSSSHHVLFTANNESWSYKSLGPRLYSHSIDISGTVYMKFSDTVLRMR